jgi:phosphotransferase system IIB component
MRIIESPTILTVFVNGASSQIILGMRVVNINNPIDLGTL